MQPLTFKVPQKEYKRACPECKSTEFTTLNQKVRVCDKCKGVWEEDVRQTSTCKYCHNKSTNDNDPECWLCGHQSKSQSEVMVIVTVCRDRGEVSRYRK